MSKMRKLIYLTVVTIIMLFSTSNLAGAETAPVPPTEYQDKVIFHTASHMAKYNSANLKGINPHILVGFIGLMVILIPITFWYRLRKKSSDKLEQRISDVINNKEDLKRFILENKIKELTQKFDEGKISQSEYDKTLNEYKIVLSLMSENQGDKDDQGKGII